MPVKPGDRVTVSMNPTLTVARYVNLKPFVSLTRDIPTDANEADAAYAVADLHATVKELVCKAALAELDVVTNSMNALGSDFNSDALETYLRREIEHAPAQTEAHAKPRDAATPPGPRAGPRRRTS